MKYMSVLKSETGWKCALVNREHKIIYIVVVEWGIVFNPRQQFSPCPLDIVGKDISMLPHFLCVIDPNYEMNKEELDYLSERKIKELNW